MAKTVTVNLTDDIDGTSADETVTFAFDGMRYEIDLGSDNATKLRAEFTAWADAGRPAEEAATDGAAEGQRPYAHRIQANAVRDWARRNGHDVAERGRLPLHLVDAFEAANQESRTG